MMFSNPIQIIVTHAQNTNGKKFVSDTSGLQRMNPDDLAASVRLTFLRFQEEIYQQLLDGLQMKCDIHVSLRITRVTS